MMQNLGRVVLVHDRLAAEGDLAARDVLNQLEAAETALHGMGTETWRLPVDLDLADFKEKVTLLRPDLVFNLVESLDGSDRLQTMVPMVLEDWGVAFTGSGSAAMLLANQKIAAKRALADRGLPFPGCAWLDGRGEFVLLAGENEPAADRGDWIVKTLNSHASLFLDDASVLRGADRETLAKRLAEAGAERRQPFFAERFIDGREFNVSVIENASGHPQVLPAAEICFANLDPGRPRIVGYVAKWDEDSGEYQATPRIFTDHPADAGLKARLSELALGAWEAFGLAGYARVDFRVDGDGEVYILEANANPCLSPGAGFAAAAERAGMRYEELMEKIVAAGLRRR